MQKVLIAPLKYVQGPGVLKNLGAHMKPLKATKALILAGKTAWSETKDGIIAGLQEAGVDYVMEYFRGECSDNEIKRVDEIVKANGCDMVVGVGGGKCMDTAKAVAYECGVRVAIIPTIAATDAPCSALSVVYSDEGVFQRYYVLPTNPDLVLVDTEVIARSPVRLLVSGMGDALATWFEADACFQASAPNIPGGHTTATALFLARFCYDTLIEYGLAAKLACEAGVPSEALERVVEANTLLSGLGFESSGLAAAHSTHDGLTELPETHHAYHGEKVAFGVLTQIVMENRPKAVIEEVLNFCVSVGLPVTLEQIGVTDTSDENLMKAAKAAAGPGMMMHNMPFKVSAERVLWAMKAADAIGRAYLASKKC